MPTASKSIMLPQNIDSSMLTKHFQPGETAVVVKLTSVGATGPFAFRDKASRCWTFRWETPLGGHIMRVPLSIWQQDNHKSAHDIALATISNNMRVVVMFMDGPKPAIADELVQTLPITVAATDFTVTTSTAAEQPIVASEPLPEPLSDETGASVPVETAPALVGPGDAETSMDAPTSENPLFRDNIVVATPAGEVLAIPDLIFNAVETPKRIKVLCASLNLDEALAREHIEASPKLSLSKQGWVTRQD